MNMPNIFATGAQVTGDSFFGRNKELNTFEEDLLRSATRGISLVGATRIGKSSLVAELGRRLRHQEKMLWITQSMGSVGNAHDFWYAVTYSIQQAVEDKDLMDDLLQKQLDQLLNVMEKENWYTPMVISLQRVFRTLKARNIVTILNLDEFDNSPAVFDYGTHHFQLLRDFYSEAQYDVKGFLISRRVLPQIESNANGISTFHGVFYEYPLQGFTPDDIDVLCSAMVNYNLFLDPPMVEHIAHYADNIPYLWCMFLHEVVNQKITQDSLTIEYIDQTFQALMPKIQSYYHDLIVRLRGDNHLEDVMRICHFRTKSPDENESGALYRKAIVPLTSLGIIKHGMCNGEDTYYAYTRDFTLYLQLEKLDIPVWDNLMAAERRLKSIFATKYGQLHTFQYNRLKFDQAQVELEVQQLYPKLNFFDITKWVGFAESLHHFKADASLLDVLTLGFIVSCIVHDWALFAPHFPGDATQWQEDLRCIRDVRNPLAHGQADYIPSTTITQLQTACDLVLEQSLVELP